VEPGHSFAEPHVVVVMGVAASGKSSVGQALAQALAWQFHDGDDLHSPANRAKMQAGTPLTDLDRAPWLAALRRLIGDVIAQDARAVVACSALKESYRRDMVPASAASEAVRFVYLDVPRATLEERLRRRRHHFFPTSLLDSQLATLEKPADAVWVDGTLPVPEIVSSVRSALGI
jgi:gluconokinase